MAGKIKLCNRHLSAFYRKHYKNKNTAARTERQRLSQATDLHAATRAKVAGRLSGGGPDFRRWRSSRVARVLDINRAESNPTRAPRARYCRYAYEELPRSCAVQLRPRHPPRSRFVAAALPRDHHRRFRLSPRLLAV